MKTLTMSIDEETLSRAESKAAAMSTSVDQVVAEYLRQWAGDTGIRDARAGMTARFARPDWQFSVGAPDSRELRNART
jgi:hypothetical protein